MPVTDSSSDLNALKASAQQIADTADTMKGTVNRLVQDVEAEVASLAGQAAGAMQGTTQVLAEKHSKVLKELDFYSDLVQKVTSTTGTSDQDLSTNLTRSTGLDYSSRL